MSKINDTSAYPSTTPAATDRLLGIDVSDTGVDANGAVKTFTTQSIADLYSVTEADVTTHEAALTITESQISDLQSYITSLLADTTPQLGGSLDVNGNKIVSTSNGNIDIEPHGTGNVLLGNFTFNADQAVGAGQDNYVLTYDHSAGTIGLEEAGGGGGLVPISKTTASSSATIDIDLSGGYSHYRVMLRNIRPGTDATLLYGRLSTDGGSTFISTSSYAYDYQSQGAGSSGTDTFATFGIITGTATGECVNGYIDIFLGNASNTWNMLLANLSWVNNSGALDQVHGAVVLNSTTTAATDIRFYFSSGNIASGDFHLYGIADGA